jgi:small conductance mechanosensitive channel
MLTLALIIGFMIMDIDLWWILWWISFGIWFAFKEILGNLIAGILVLTNKEFKLGEIISVDDDKYDYFWRIEEITIRYTVIRTFDLRKVVIPNLTLITRPVRTYDSEEAVRLDTVVTVHYQTDLHQATEWIKDAVNSVSYVKERESTRVSIQKFTERGADILIYFYFDPKAGMLIQTAKSGVHQAIYDMFLEKWIIIPYPHQVMTFDHNDKNLLGSLLYVGKELKK